MLPPLLTIMPLLAPQLATSYTITITSIGTASITYHFLGLPQKTGSRCFHIQRTANMAKQKPAPLISPITQTLENGSGIFFTMCRKNSSMHDKKEAKKSATILTTTISIAAARILFSLSDWNNSSTNPIKNIGYSNTEKVCGMKDSRPKILQNSHPQKEKNKNSPSLLLEAPKNFLQNLSAAQRYPRKNGATIIISVHSKSCFIESLRFPS